MEEVNEEPFLVRAFHDLLYEGIRGGHGAAREIVNRIPYVGNYLEGNVDYIVDAYLLPWLDDPNVDASDRNSLTQKLMEKYPKYKEYLINKSIRRQIPYIENLRRINHPVETGIVKKVDVPQKLLGIPYQNDSYFGYKRKRYNDIYKTGNTMVLTRPSIMPKTWQRRTYQRKLKRYVKRFRRYKGVNSADSYVFDSYTNYPIASVQGLRLTKAIPIRDILTNSVLWTQTAPLYNQFKVTYLTLEVRQILAPRYFLNMPILAINCLYNVNDPDILTFNEVRSASGSKVYHMEKNYYVYRHKFKFTNSPSPGLGKYEDIDKANQNSYIPTDACLTRVFLFTNTEYLMDLSGLPGGTTDDVTDSKLCFTLHWRLWVKLKGKMA